MITELLRYATETKHWPLMAMAHLHKNFPQKLPLRDGNTIYFLNPEAEIRAFQSIYWDHDYDSDFSGIPANGTVIDLGANVGIFTLYAATKLVPHGQVLAVEAVPDTFDRLRMTTSKCSNVTNWLGAIGGAGELWLAHDSLGASIYHDSDSVRKISTPGIPMGKVFQFSDHIDMLKMNMEGAEYPFILETDSPLWKRVDRVSVKWHKGEIAGEHHPDMLRDQLIALGFKVHRHQDIWKSPRLTTGITTASRITAS